MTPILDIHTHHLPPQPGSAVVNVPMEDVLSPDTFRPVPGHVYSAGIHPLYDGDWEQAWSGVKVLTRQNVFHSVGECGIDKRSPVSLSTQIHYMELQMKWAGDMGKPLVIHCVRAWNELLCLQSMHPACSPRIVHGFRGKPELARRLLAAGFHLSFGPRFNPQSLLLCPSDKRLLETDDSPYTISQVAQMVAHVVSRDVGESTGNR